MRFTAGVFANGAFFFAIGAAIYWFTSNEPAGTVLLALTGVLCLVLVVFIGRHARRPAAPEDQPDLPAAVASDVGSFPTASPWPIILAAGATLLGLALAYGTWLLLAGAAIVLLAAVGYISEGG